MKYSSNNEGRDDKHLVCFINLYHKSDLDFAFAAILNELYYVKTKTKSQKASMTQQYNNTRYNVIACNYGFFAATHSIATVKNKRCRYKYWTNSSINTK